MNKEILKEHIGIIILNVLKTNESTLYYIGENINKKLNKQINIEISNIYLEIKKLEKANYVTSNWIENKVHDRIKKYSITKEGNEYFESRKKEWENSKKVLDKLLGDN